MLAAAAVARAEEPVPQAEALVWLQRVANAARQLNYAGTFVYQHGEFSETSKLVHMTDGHGEWEKLATQDGRRCEVVRVNDELSTYLPDLKQIRIESRSARRAFPALPPEQLSAITEYYTVVRIADDRVAGYDTQVFKLEPRDGLRYGHKFWAESASGLLVKAQMTNDRHQMMEQFMFTVLAINTPLNRELVKPSIPPGALDWNIIRFRSDDSSDADVGWMVKAPPAGFRKVMAMRRSREGDPAGALVHIVLSDGLAAVSVFIEPVGTRGKATEGPSQQGVINIFTRTLGDQRITALGETPATTVQLIANSTVQKLK